MFCVVGQGLFIGYYIEFEDDAQMAGRLLIKSSMMIGVVITNTETLQIVYVAVFVYMFLFDLFRCSHHQLPHQQPHPSQIYTYAITISKLLQLVTPKKRKTILANGDTCCIVSTWSSMT